MRCTVTMLRNRGIALSRKDWPEPIAGTLSMSEQPQRGKPTVRVLYLMTAQGSALRTAAALFEPQLYQTVDDGFVLRGFERATLDGATTTYEQLWLVRPGAG